MKRMRILLGISLVLSAAGVFAQEVSDQDKDRQYVTDQLRLSLYAEADSRSQVIKLLQSGDLLEISEISGPYALVTSPDGTRGWVKRGFLVTKPTSKILLQEEQQKTESLAEEIEKLANSKVVIEQYESDMKQMEEKFRLLESEKDQATNTITKLEQVIEAKQQEIDYKNDNSAPASVVLLDTLKRFWQYILPIILLIILLSFIVCKGLVEARIKSRFHGIKIW